MRWTKVCGLDRWLRRGDGLMPPQRLQDFVGDGFEAVGAEFVGYFRDLCDLQPGQSVLDIGCGCGRMAIPLLDHLDRHGRYVGFDIAPDLILWCAGNLTPRNAEFTFHLANIHNKHYNPHGTCRASEYRFPCADQSIDFVFATSVFTHMLPDDVRHYLHEIRRVLRPGGRGLLTHFILNADSESAMNRTTEGLKFRFPRGDCFAAEADDPESALAYAEPTLRAMYANADLRIAEPIRFGSWSGRSGGLSYQDIVLIES